jgi:glycosyltransferase involved in cell wall biosynthesis
LAAPGATRPQTTRSTRILHVINSLDPSGGERHLVNLFAPLEALGVENHLVTFYPGNGFEAQVKAHVRRAELSLGHVKGFAAAVRMAREVDVVHTQLTYADIVGRVAAAVAGTPSVTTIQSSAWAPENRPVLHLDPLRYHLYRMSDCATARLATRFFAVSGRAAQAYTDAFNVPADRVEVIANTVNLQAFDPALGPSREEARAALGFAPHEFAVVTLARLVPMKALPDAVRAVAIAAKTHSVRMVIAGIGPEQATLQASIDAAHAPVRMVGRRDAVSVLKAADLFVLPSRVEGMPLSLIEAMAMGVPCLCSNIPENVETGGDAAVYAPERDPEALAKAMMALIDDPARRAALARDGRVRARRYASEVVAERFLRGIEGALAKRNAHGARRPVAPTGVGQRGEVPRVE